MAKAKKDAKPRAPHLSSRQQIQEKLEQVLADLKPSLGEKKFKRRMKKAGKLISSGLGKKLKANRVEAEAPAPAEG
ncbi:MAG: hypothetical protein INR73_01140 [Williamsia sp.]|nr:hypothetical protein [Williamsia sp.]